IAPVFVVLAAEIAKSAILSTGSGAEFQRSFQAHSGAILALDIPEAIATAALPLAYLLLAAQGRNPRVQAPMLGFAVLGPLLLGAQFIAGWVANDQVSKDYVAKAPQVRKLGYGELRRQLERQPGAISKVTIFTDARVAEVEYADGSFADATYPAQTAGRDTEPQLASLLDAKGVDSEEDSSGDPGDAVIADIASDSSARAVEGLLFLAGAIFLIVAMVYTSLQATRVGLLPRAFGTAGVVLGLAVILLGALGFFLVLLWLAYFALLLLGRVPGGRPPAWDAGEAIPWPAPGQAAEPKDAPLEGEAREVGGEAGGQTGAPRRKRKRRR